jgi:hypothetical protein
MPARKNPATINRDLRVLSLGSKRELVELAMDLLRREGSLGTVGADPAKLRTFVEGIGDLYHENPYHNFHHAVDVTNTAAWMATRPVIRRLLTDNQRFWLLIAALAHDADHRGRNNQWEVYTSSELAKRYHNLSVLERHALDLTLRVMERPECQFHATMAPRDVAEGRALLEDMILATDFAMHREFLNVLVAQLGSGDGAPEPITPEFQRTIAKAVIKAADIANTTREYTQARLWGRKVMEEFWAQGRLEKERAFPVGPLNDPDKVNLNQAQAGFIKFAAMELYELMARLDPAIEELVAALRDNIRNYETSEDEDRGGLIE